jgi:acetyl esterase/lipase
VRRSTYLAATAAGAAGVINAHRPIARDGAMQVPSFVFGLLDSELPLGRVATQAAIVGLAARSGLLGNKSGKALAAVNMATIAGALHLRYLGSQAGDVLEAALIEELGTGYRDRIAPLPSPAQAVRRRGPMPLAHRRYVVGDSRNISYGDAGKRNLLDIWRRPDLPIDARAPVLVQVHGGAWTWGDKRGQATPLMSTLAEHGWVCVSITYRLSPRATWPEHIVDVLRAIAWTKANIERYGGDPRFLAVTGGSAGGHLSALAALAANDPAFQPGFEDTDTSVQAAVPFYGSYDWLNRNLTNQEGLGDFLAKRIVKQTIVDARDLYDRASPLSRVRADAPPFFVIHGTCDSLLHVEQAREFAESLRKASSSPVVYAELPGAQHAFDSFASPRTLATVDAVERFLGVVYGEYRNR